MSDTDVNDTEKARRAPHLILIGLVALVVAGWGLGGSPTLPDIANLVWVVVAVAVVVGLSLIFVGARSGPS